MATTKPKPRTRPAQRARPAPKAAQPEKASQEVITPAPRTLPPTVTRVCCMCCSRQRGDQLLDRGPAGPVCLDERACSQRAAAAGLYAMSEASPFMTGGDRVTVSNPRPAVDPATQAIERNLAAEARHDAGLIGDGLDHLRTAPRADRALEV